MLRTEKDKERDRKGIIDRQRERCWEWKSHIERDHLVKQEKSNGCKIEEAGKGKVKEKGGKRKRERDRLRDKQKAKSVEERSWETNNR